MPGLFGIFRSLSYDNTHLSRLFHIYTSPVVTTEFAFYLTAFLRLLIQISNTTLHLYNGPVITTCVCGHLIITVRVLMLFL
jgi:hypothetical protein